MKVLVACEFSGIVREAFRKRGHDAWSCDLLPAEDGSIYHYRDDVTTHSQHGWDMMIAFPPCTHLAVSGARWFKDKQGEQAEAIAFVQTLMDAPIPHIALENPVGVISTKIRKPDQIIQPWQFGHTARKTTCLWLKGPPPLLPTKIVKPELYTDYRGRTYSKDYLFDGDGKWLRYRGQGHRRSITYQGIADAMAEQWG